jgi:pimeloyl-ACP methyl ester carboxylesterase
LKDLVYTVTFSQEALAAAKGNVGVALTKADKIIALLHGWAGRREVWGNFPELVALFSQSQLAVFNTDMPGMGRSSYKDGVNGLSQSPKGIEELLRAGYQAMGIEPPLPHQKVVHIMHSMGPTMALAYWQELLTDPQHGFVLMAPFLPELSTPHRVLACGVLAGSMRALYTPMAGGMIGRAASPAVTRVWGGPHTQDYVTAAHAQTVKETSPQMLARTMTALGRERPMEKLRETQGLKDAQALVVAAPNDGFTPGNEVIRATLEAGLDKAKVYSMPDAGHYLFSIPLLHPPADLPQAREALADWVLEQAAQNPNSHFTQVIELAQRTARFVDEL